MSRTDEELKRALDEGDPHFSSSPAEAGKVNAEVGEVPAVSSPAPARGRPRSKPTRSIGLLIGLLTMAGVILTVVLTGVDKAAVYSKGVDELLEQRARIGNRTVRVVGTLVSGSLARRDEPCEYRFQLARGPSTITVHYPQCVVPDTFRDVPGVKVEVTAEGKLTEDGSFLAHQIMAKCPSKYDMKQRQTNGGSMTPSSMVMGRSEVQ